MRRFEYDHPGDLFRIEQIVDARYIRRPYYATKDTPKDVEKRMKRKERNWRGMGYNVRVKYYRLVSNKVREIIYYPEVLQFRTLEQAIHAAEKLSGEKVQLNALSV